MRTRIITTVALGSMIVWCSEIQAAVSCRASGVDWTQVANQSSVIVVGELQQVVDKKWIKCDQEVPGPVPVLEDSCWQGIQVQVVIKNQQSIKGAAPAIVRFTGELPPMYDMVCGEEPKLRPGLGVVVFLEQTPDGLHLIRGYSGLQYTTWGHGREMDWPSTIRKFLGKSQPEQEQ